MAPFPDFGTWLLRSVRGGDANPDSAVSVIERLNALPRPLRNAADKDTLVGAVLTLGPSLQLALHILLELLPEDDDRERLGEVLCPTLGQLQRSLTDTLLSLRGPQDDKSKKSFAANRAKHMRGRSNTLPLPSEILFRGVRIDRSIKTPSAAPTLAQVPESPATYPSPDRIDESPLEDFLDEPELPLPSSQPPPPPPTITTATKSLVPVVPVPTPLPTVSLSPLAPPTPRSPSPTPSARRPDPAADLALVKELRAEMRVNAAIQVAVDSLEFAEGQLKIVKNVHRLHGGSFQLLEKHFYQGYNRILFRALELERREFDSPSGSDYCPSPRLVCDDMGDLRVEGKMEEEKGVVVPQRTISFEEKARDEAVPVLQLEPPSPEKGAEPDAKTVGSRPASPEKRMVMPVAGPGPELMRRNTAPGLTGKSFMAFIRYSGQTNIGSRVETSGEDTPPRQTTALPGRGTGACRRQHHQRGGRERRGGGRGRRRARTHATGPQTPKSQLGLGRGCRFQLRLAQRQRRSATEDRPDGVGRVRQ